MSDGAGTGPAGRRVLLGRQLLDHQVVDAHGRLAGKVDDLELTLPDDAADPGGRPVVTAILSGRGALAQRLGGRLGRLAVVLSRRLLPDSTGDGRIPFRDVTSIDDGEVTIAGDAHDLATGAVEGALRRSVVERIPGSGRPGAP